MKKQNLSTMAIRMLSVVAVAAMFVISGCGDDDGGGTPAPTQNVWQVVQARAELSGLAAELEAAGLNDALATTNNITLFAPSNAALNTLLTTLGIPDFSPIREDVVNAVLSYHVANSAILSSELTAGTEITTLVPGETIEVIAGPKLRTGATSDAEIQTADLLATNGVVHIVNVVLVPPTIGDLIVSTLGTLAQPILLSSDFSFLADAMQYAEPPSGQPTLIEILSDVANPGTNYTVFAPSNAVFTATGITLETFTPAEWYGVLAHHVGVGIYEEAALTTGTMITTATGGTITVTNAGTGGDYTSIFLNSNLSPDFEAEIAQLSAAVQSNGVIHPIAGILLP